MQITEVRISPIEGHERVRAYATITFDHCFVVRDLRIIDGAQGVFVAMPALKVQKPCPVCQTKNIVQATFCNRCGNLLPAYDPIPGERTHDDIAHPIKMYCRKMITDAVIKAYEEAVGMVEVGR